MNKEMFKALRAYERKLNMCAFLYKRGSISLEEYIECIHKFKEDFMFFVTTSYKFDVIEKEDVKKLVEIAYGIYGEYLNFK